LTSPSTLPVSCSQVDINGGVIHGDMLAKKHREREREREGHLEDTQLEDIFVSMIM